MSKYSKELEANGYRVRNDYEHGHSNIVVDEKRDSAWVFVGEFSSRKSAVERLVAGGEL